MQNLNQTKKNKGEVIISHNEKKKRTKKKQEHLCSTINDKQRTNKLQIYLFLSTNFTPVKWYIHFNNIKKKNLFFL